MKKIKVLSIFGTRPEAIKMAPLVKELQKREEIDAKVLLTAQHREMLDSVMELFDLEADHDLDIMKSGQSITDITSRVLYGVESVLQEEKPDLVLVHGDTTTTFASALAAFYQKIPVGHIEAGLRTGNMYSPYPEEMNRCLTTRIAEYYFCPTQNNYQNLVDENVSTEHLYITGNTVIDALLSVIKDDYRFDEEALNELKPEERLLLLTCHRRENWGERMENIFKAVNRITEKHSDIKVVFPMHLNPIVRNAAYAILGDNPKVILTEPMDYEPFANLIAKSVLVMTDSGGIQEEAPALGKPVVVLRTETERPEAVAAGTVKVVGVEQDAVFAAVDELLSDDAAYEKMAKAVNPYGDGTASKQIVDHIIQNVPNVNQPT